MRIVLSPEARGDLRAIKAHSQRSWGAATAVRTLERIEAAWLALARFPGLGKPIPGHPQWLRVEVSPHLVVAERRGKTLHVLRVLDARRDPDHMF
jgi:plasmid stabilization system protein ParE